MTKKLRMGVIGVGAIAQVMHIPHLVDYDERFELVALSDISEPALQAVGERYHISDLYTDWHNLLARKDIDAVIIAHGGSHRDSVIASVQAGKHVLCEKPLAWNQREVREVLEVVNPSDRIVQMAYHKRFDPALPIMQEELATIDDLGFARVTVLHPANELGLSPHRIRRGNGVMHEGHYEFGTYEEQLRNHLQIFGYGELQSQVDEVLGDRKGDDRLRLAYGMINVSIIHQIYMLDALLGDPIRVCDTQVWRDGFSIHTVIEYPNDLRCTLDWHFLAHLKDYREEYLFCGNRKRVALNFPSPYYHSAFSPITVQGGEGELAWEKTIKVSTDEAFRNELFV